MSPLRHADPPVVLTPERLRAWPLPAPDESGDKHTRGQVLVVGGSRQTPGAVLLAGVAALRAGAGTLQLATVGAASTALAVAVPEALVVPLPETPGGAVAARAADGLAELADLAGRAGAVLVGPGLADPDETSALLERLLPAVGEQATVVLDAMALGCAGAHPELLTPVRGRLVLTPNAGELARLAGQDAVDDIDDVAATAADVARTLDAVVAARGHVAAPDGRSWQDEAGGVGLGTSGSGDVLAGLVAGLAARGAEPAQAACWGVHLHGAAGDRLAARIGRLGFLARELLDEAPLVLAQLQT